MSKPGRDAALDAQMAEVRELLTEFRGTIKDLRAAAREGREVLAELREAIAEAPDVYEHFCAGRMESAVAEQIAELTRLTREHTDEAVARIDVRFDEYTALLMTGRENWRRRDGKLDLRPANLVIGEGHPLKGEFE